MKNRPRICHVGKNYQMRAAKLTAGLHDAYSYYIGTDAPLFVESAHLKLYCVAPPHEDRITKNIIELSKFIDIFQVHTLPDIFVKWVKEATDKPVIWDCHDLFSLFDKDKGKDEHLARANCDAIISVNETLTKIVADGKQVPTSWYKPMLPRGWFPPIEDGHRNELVIPTGLSPVYGHYRYWIDVFKELVGLGIKVKCYGSSYEPPKDYVETGADMHGATPHPFLMGDISQAEAGICGFPFHNDLTRVASPNKFYEYIAAGIPSICFGECLMADEIREHQMGVVVESASEVPEALKKIRKDKIRKRVRKVRFQYCMETQAGRVMDFYKEVVK